MVTMTLSVWYAIQSITHLSTVHVEYQSVYGCCSMAIVSDGARGMAWTWDRIHTTMAAPIRANDIGVCFDCVYRICCITHCIVTKILWIIGISSL